MKLSEAQRKALAAINEDGGVAIAEGGGWWRGATRRLGFPVSDWRGTDSVGTSTIYALEKRGLLERTNSDLMHRATRRITEAGRRALEE